MTPALTAQQQAEVLRLVRTIERAAREQARIKYGAGVKRAAGRSPVAAAYDELKDYLKEL